ncbi:MAG: Mo-dependent nitrogenase C-terminal domain-containing protein [Myxacorys californica WJT36-NPBG1]|jgi:hypothetical protein|nr:Mo-dependent nitrogenase C-terminal domain-containing protein [Myxacorys californica WJT36-NPBG1]
MSSSLHEKKSHSAESELIFGATSMQAYSLQQKPGFDPLKPIRQWLDSIEIRDRKVAHTLCKLIPAQCPFERDITMFGRAIAHIPPMCKINPLYEQFVGLRFRSLCYLVDECGETI